MSARYHVFVSGWYDCSKSTTRTCSLSVVWIPLPDYYMVFNNMSTSLYHTSDRIRESANRVAVAAGAPWHPLPIMDFMFLAVFCQKLCGISSSETTVSWRYRWIGAIRDCLWATLCSATGHVHFQPHKKTSFSVFSSRIGWNSHLGEQCYILGPYCETFMVVARLQASIEGINSATAGPGVFCRIVPRRGPRMSHHAALQRIIVFKE